MVEKLLSYTPSGNDCDPEATHDSDNTQPILKNNSNDDNIHESTKLIDDTKPSLSHISVIDDKDVTCKPDGMIFGPDNPFFAERFNNKKILKYPHVKYDPIGPFGNEPDPDIEFYPKFSNYDKGHRFPDMFPPGGGFI